MEQRLTSVARRLRRDQTESERRLWARLRESQLDGAKFRRQVPIGGYVADFACYAARLIVEVDGGQHADNPADAVRTRALEALGYHVVRFWSTETVSNTDGVVETIRRELLIARGGDLVGEVATLSPRPFPRREGEKVAPLPGGEREGPMRSMGE